MKNAGCVLVVSVCALIIGACENSDPASPGARTASLTLDRVLIDTTVTATAGAFVSIHNNLMPEKKDSTLEYTWEIYDVGTPSASWAVSICDPQACIPPGQTSATFRFANGFPGFFWVDWFNSDADVTAGVCSLKVRIFPNAGGDTLFYRTLLRITR